MEKKKTRVCMELINNQPLKHPTTNVSENENRLLPAVDSHEISCLMLFLKKEHILKLSSAANKR